MFDPAASFVVVKRMKVGSSWHEPHPTKLFDKGLVDRRLLRILYDQNYIDAAPTKVSAPKAVKGKVGKSAAHGRHP